MAAGFDFFDLYLQGNSEKWSTFLQQIVLFSKITTTVDNFRLQWNNYKDNNRKYLRKESCMQQQFFEHFSSESQNSFLDDVSIIFIDKIDPKHPNKREHYSRHTLKTMAPQGLHVDDDWCLQFCFTYISRTIYSIAMTACIRKNQFRYWTALLDG